jgi:hypothetical protein
MAFESNIPWNFDNKAEPSGGWGFGGGISPGSSFEPPSGLPSTGDSDFWKNQPTDSDYYNKDKFDPKNFLSAFAKGLGQDKDKYRQQAEQSGYQTGRQGATSENRVEKIAPDISLYTPTVIPGSPGKKGFGGAIGKFAGAALGIGLAPFTGGSSLALAGPLSNIGGSIGEAFS